MHDRPLTLILCAEAVYILVGFVCVILGFRKPRQPGRLLKRLIRPTKRSRSRVAARISYLRSIGLEQDAEKTRPLEKYSLSARGFDWSGLLIWVPFIYLAAAATIVLMRVDASVSSWQQATTNLVVLELCCLVVILDSLISRRKVSRDKVIAAGLQVLDQCARVAESPSGGAGTTAPLGQLRRKVRHYRWNLLYHGAFSMDLGGLSGPAWSEACSANHLLKSTADKLLNKGSAEAGLIARAVCYQIYQVPLALPGDLIPAELRKQIDEEPRRDISLPSIRLISGSILLILATCITTVILNALGAGSAMTAAGTLTVPVIGFWLKSQLGPRSTDRPVQGKEVPEAGAAPENEDPEA
jgi:hypothetical protein